MQTVAETRLLSETIYCEAGQPRLSHYLAFESFGEGFAGEAELNVVAGCENLADSQQ